MGALEPGVLSTTALGHVNENNSSEIFSLSHDLREKKRFAWQDTARASRTTAHALIDEPGHTRQRKGARTTKSSIESVAGTALLLDQL
jgi:hypothetical protein